jgi:hypothetical protein
MLRHVVATRVALVALAALALLLSPAAAGAARPSVAVSGGGKALLTYTGADLPAGPHPVTFAIAATIADGGAANGHVNFVFKGGAACAWGALPGVDTIHLTGTVTAGSVAPDGTITLAGISKEVDIATGQGVVLVEETPFTVRLGGALGPGAFVLQWCALQPFQGTVTGGTLRVR